MKINKHTNTAPFSPKQSHSLVFLKSLTFLWCFTDRGVTFQLGTNCGHNINSRS